MPRVRTQWFRCGRAVLVTVAVSAAFGALAGAASAAYPGGDGRIAFVRGGNIDTITDTGTGLHRLTGSGDCTAPRWSPNGAEIAYVCGGNLWMMDANGTHKTRLINAAPRSTESRPSWSPNGAYLAFVQTKRHHAYGYLKRYDLATRTEVTFSTPYQSENPTARQVKVTALPDAVAWGWALSGGTYGSFIVFNGAGTFCQPHRSCLSALGASAQSQYRNEFPSSEDQSTLPKTIANPDWFPDSPQFDTDVLTSWASCPHGSCTPAGLRLTITSSLSHPGAYEAVYSPDGSHIAYVLKHDGVPTIYSDSLSPEIADVPVQLTTGSEPDWQPLPVN